MSCFPINRYNNKIAARAATNGNRKISSKIVSYIIAREKFSTTFSLTSFSWTIKIFQCISIGFKNNIGVIPYLFFEEKKF